jgi:hypothetical protein
VDEIVQMAKERKFLAIFHIPYGRLKEEENVNLLSREALRSVMQKIIDYKNFANKIISELNNYLHCFCLNLKLSFVLLYSYESI